MLAKANGKVTQDSVYVVNQVPVSPLARCHGSGNEKAHLFTITPTHLLLRFSLPSPHFGAETFSQQNLKEEQLHQEMTNPLHSELSLYIPTCVLHTTESVGNAGSCYANWDNCS